MHWFRFFAALAGVLAMALPAVAQAGAPVFREHLNFTSDPFEDELCGIEGISVDRVVATFSADASGATLERLNVRTLFTSSATGKSLEIHSAGARRAAPPVDNGDGTYSIVTQNSGPSPIFKLPNGPMVWHDVGLIEFRLTFDQATGDFVSFEVTRMSGPKEPGCDAIVAALS
jgi:hypothetical protein